VDPDVDNARLGGMAFPCELNRGTADDDLAPDPTNLRTALSKRLPRDLLRFPLRPVCFIQ
jgi:hypothetical protein